MFQSITTAAHPPTNTRTTRRRTLRYDTSLPAPADDLHSTLRRRPLCASPPARSTIASITDRATTSSSTSLRGRLAPLWRHVYTHRCRYCPLRDRPGRSRATALVRTSLADGATVCGNGGCARARSDRTSAHVARIGRRAVRRITVARDRASCSHRQGRRKSEAASPRGTPIRSLVGRGTEGSAASDLFPHARAVRIR